mmetsp:Transcript_5957/g.11027  ORF Transcript_5957/g.11027 Transcript_5957/m.11027 type:complete len:307 (+) Transcript_5957:4103-5023(+)
MRNFGNSISHHQCIVGAGLNADRAPSAIFRCNLDTVLHTLIVALRLSRHERLGRTNCLLICQHKRTDCRMRADIGTVIALGALVVKPLRDESRNGSLSVLCCTHGENTTRCEHTDGKLVALEIHHWTHDHVNELISCLGLWRIVAGIGPGSRDLDLGWDVGTGVDSFHNRLVHLDNLGSFFAVLFLDGILEQAVGLLQRKHTRQLEENGLHKHIDTLPQTEFVADLPGINDVEFHLLLSQLPADSRWEILLKFIGGPTSVENKSTTILDLIEQGETPDVLLKMARNVIRIGDQVLGCDWLRPEPQV